MISYDMISYHIISYQTRLFVANNVGETRISLQYLTNAFLSVSLDVIATHLNSALEGVVEAK